MSKKTKAMRLALEVLEQWNAPLYKRGIAITALREALAEQFCDTHCTWLNHHPDCDKAEQPAREWVELTQEEIDLVWDSIPETQFWWRHYARAIEDKLKEKNT
jgi:hypothetical protein